MKFAVTLALAVATSTTTTSNGLKLDLHDDGSYDLLVGDATWLQSGPTWFYANGVQNHLSSSNLQKKTTTQGSDTFGSYTSTELAYAIDSAGNTASNTAAAAVLHVSTIFKEYTDGSAVEFEQVWTSGATNTNSSTDPSWTISSFPSFKLEAASGAPPLGVMGWLGTFIDDSTSGPAMGTWPTGLAAVGKTAGANTLFDMGHAGGAGAGGDAVVISSSSQFMSHVMAANLSNPEFLMAGILGTVKEIPAGFKTSTMLYHGKNGVNNVMTSFGTALRQRYNKPDGRASDYQVTHLGFNTDHGAYYYYKTEEGKNYYQTLLDVKTYADEQNIPYKHVLLDSWWYYKGDGGGVAEWTVRPDIFPGSDGKGGDAALAEFHKATGWPIIGHNRYWSWNTNYSIANGGKWAFSDSTDHSKYVVPLEQGFWDWLLGKSKAWGLATYEQDWLYNEFNNVPLLTENVTMGREWLLQMGRAAEKNNLTVQYCMAYPRHAMQSVEIPAVTQIRASDDYVPGSEATPPNWDLGGSSILAHALALAPFKDNYWTVPNQHGGGSLPQGQDLGFALHGCVSTLSAGPVTPSDGIGLSNREVIMRSSRSDGVLLHPSRPATYTDVMIANQAAKGARAGHLWSTYTAVAGGYRWDHIMAKKLPAGVDVVPAMLTLDGGRADGELTIAFTLNTTTFDLASLQVQHFGESTPLYVGPDVTAQAFELWHVAPVLESGWALLGDLSKWVPASASRVSYVKEAGTVIGIVGEPKEVVVLHFAAVAKKNATKTETETMAEKERTTEKTSTEEQAAAASYTAHPKNYCDDGRPSNQHQHAYVSNADTLEQCQQHCTAVNCTCFDFKRHKSSGSAAAGAAGSVDASSSVAGETMWACRVNTVATTLTSSGGGYTAYTLVPPPAPPPPPPPPQLKTVTVTCTVGPSGVAVARLDTNTVQWQCAGN